MCSMISICRHLNASSSARTSGNKRLRTNGNRGLEEASVRPASQNGTLSRVNRANEAVWLRQGRRLYFSLTHRALVRLSVHPSVPRLHGAAASLSASAAELTEPEKADTVVERSDREIDVARCPA